MARDKNKTNQETDNDTIGGIKETKQKNPKRSKSKDKTEATTESTGNAASTGENVKSNEKTPDSKAGGPSLSVHKSFASTPIENVIFENAIHTSPEVFDSINKYRGTLKNAITVGQGPPGNTNRKSKKTVRRIIYETVGAPSLFNPYYGVQAVGITSGIPLMDTQTHTDKVYAESNYNKPKLEKQINLGYDINDCSIANLVELSKRKFSSLGHAKYKYTDFMYCKEVGKISNNHLITLRRFSYPVGDNIFGETTLEDDSNLSVTGDIGHLVTWFGTEDNNLEDLFHYSYHSTWKTLDAKIQEEQSQESAPERGVMGGLVNLFSPGYNNATAKGIAPSALSLILGSSGSDAFLDSAPYANNPAVNGSCYDKNRVYEPQDTIRSMEIPEGKLEFSHEFSLTFNYKLRGYDNINAKSALLDLLANIMVVTYKAGKFWPGEQRIIGAPPNPSGWKKVEQFKNDAWAAGGTFLTSMLNGGNFTDSVNGLLSGLSDSINSNFGIDLSSISSFGDLGKLAQDIIGRAGDAGFGGALKGMVSNQLGRPAVYAFDSLLSGDNSGLWHVTIGNPLNPIAVMGNLIMTGAEISHSGPLGLDDFPTELKLVVNLKHARPRDSVDIQRMYTWGRNAIYGKIGADANFAGPLGNSADTSVRLDSITSTNVITISSLDKLNVKDGSSEQIGWIGETSRKRFRTGNVDTLN
jgi:hypothetical protein